MDRKPGELLTKMLVLAVNGHAGQYDKGGLPYILHPLKVMYYLKSDDEELQCIALGHDLIEDCKVTFQQLYDLGFPERVINGIRCLTRMPGETEVEYRTKVKSNRDSIKTKKCDLRHNSDIRRLKGVTEKDIRRTAKYHEFYMELQTLEN